MTAAAVPVRGSRSRWKSLLPRSRPKQCVVAIVLVAGTLLLLAFAAVLAIDAGWADRILVRWASRTLEREVTISNIHVRLLSARPGLTIGKVTVFNPAWAGGGQLGVMDSVSATVRPRSILSGNLQLPEVTIGRLDLHLIRQRSGRNNWTLGKPRPGQRAFGFLRGVKALRIADGHVDFRDEQNDFAFRGAFRHEPIAGGALALAGSGSLNGDAVILRAEGGPLNGDVIGRAYPFVARIIDGGTVIDARGHSGQPFDLASYGLSMRLRGPNLADLFYLFKIQTPNSAPYALSVYASANGPMVKLTDLAGRVGGSDFRGSIESDQSSPHHRVHADLTFGTWTKADIELALAPTPPRSSARSVPGKSEGPTKSRWLLSDQPFPIERLGLVDIAATLHIFDLSGFTTPLTDVRAHVNLTRGNLSFSNISAHAYGGFLSGVMRLDARSIQPKISVHGSLRAANLALIAPRSRARVSGIIDVDADLFGSGRSLHRAAAASFGRLTIGISQSRTSPAVDFMIGGDTLRALLSLGASEKSVQLDCARAEFIASAGNLSSRGIVVQTPSGVTTGIGTIDLSSENLDIVLTGYPIRKRLFQVSMPVRISGPWAHPNAMLLPARNAQALGLKGKLGVILSPVAAIVPIGRRTPAPIPVCHS